MVGRRLLSFVALAVSSWVAGARAENILKASSLVTCMENSALTASEFDVVFTPDNRTVSYDVSANVAISGNVTALVTVYAYGINIIEKKLDPCDMNMNQLCPLTSGQIDIQSHSTLSESIVSSIPGVAYNVPDIDAVVYVRILDDTNTMQACIQASFTNTKTVDHVAVKWVTAVISGIGLLTSAILSMWGNSYTAAHVATNSLALFAYFQSVVIVCMQAVDRVPPIASAWAQNLAWSMGLIEVEFMQKIFRWYVQATGGTPTTYLRFKTISILVQKRNVLENYLNPRFRDFLATHGQTVSDFLSRNVRLLASRGTSEGKIDTVAHSSSTLLVLRGIKRMAYQAGIEQTAVVLTGFTFFVLICVALAIVFAFVRFVLIFAFKSKYDYFRTNWKAMLKGTILRLVFIGFSQLLILSLWEFIERDSAAVIILAVFFLILSIGILAWNSFKVFVIGQRSIATHDTPVYLLYSEPEVINKYGFLYTQFEGNHYYFIAPVLIYTFVKACFISFAQSSGKTQGIAIFIIELAFVILVGIKKPYMDKITNAINITIGSILTLNAFFFMFFSGLFGQPMYVSSIMGVIFFVLNAAFSLVLLLFTLITCTIVIFFKNPDSRYKPAKDDRASFIQEQGKPNPDVLGEFTALGAAARADHDDAGLLHPSPHTGADDASISSSYPSEKRHSGYEVSTYDESESSATPRTASKQDVKTAWEPLAE
ncbi:Flc1p [Sugiyamaella lignohabitans]|uniref:Flc1p n=1 Tax=Sugiyamaella lignohabitans TaxID=796027 RepID=A0A167EKV1_9ASCO|nr:Flc1p [Sugiyamaella lignohabitans]ANB14194.1 Flc1p [Sugiyamaella lignohabitans]